MLTEKLVSIPLDPRIEVELIEWRQSRFETITQEVEDALPRLLGEIDDIVSAMGTVAAARAQMWPDATLKQVFVPWTTELASRIEAETEEEMTALVASLSTKGTAQDAVRAALPTLASAGMLAASMAAIPSILAMATTTTTAFLVFSAPAFSWPVFVVGGVGLAAATLGGGRVVDRISARNRAHLAERLKGRAVTAALGYGLAAGARCLVTDLQVATLRNIELKVSKGID